MKDKMNKVTAIFLLISSICLVLIWLALYFAGWINDYFDGFKFKTAFLIFAEAITAILMFISGVKYFIGKSQSNKLRLFSLGMLFYALLIGLGEFTDRKIYFLTFLFTMVLLATAIISIANIRLNDRKAAEK